MFERPTQHFLERREKGKGRKRLLELQETGEYVFHGSLNDIDILEPRQAFIWDEEKGKRVKDGNPSVFATPYADIAIFRALVNRQGVNEPSRSQFGEEKEKGLSFAATKNLLEAAKGKRGKVYVLKKEDFDHCFGSECVAEREVVPVEVIEVHFDDLPPSITVLEGPEKKSE